MDKKVHSKSSIFSRLNPTKCEHLTPLSIYSRMITCDQKANIQQASKFSNPFINFKIEVLNDYDKKRKFEDSSPDDSYETPTKKVFSPKALSPDLGCFMDFSSPLARQDSVSPFAIFEPVVIDKTQPIKTETKETVSSELRSEHVECLSSTEPGANKGTVPHNLKCEMVLLNPAPDFDCDVDDILCLNPSGTYTTGRSPDSVESCKSPSSNTFQNKPVLIPTVAHGQELERREGQVEEDRQELLVYQNVKDVEEDKGYFSMSYIKDLKLGKNPSQSAYPQLPPATSRIGEVDAPDDERCHPEGSSEPDCHKQTAGLHTSFTARDLCHVVSGPLLGPVNSPVEPLEGDVEEVWNIGSPIFESSVCHSVTVELNAGNEHNRQVSEEVQGGVAEHIHECQTTLSKESAIWDASYESTPPLHVKVKSVVVAPRQQTCSNKPVSQPLPKLNTETTKPRPNENRDSHTARYVSTSKSQRPATFNRVVDWEAEKHLYFHSITRHLTENPGADQEGVMTELRNLMTHVADQTPGSNGRQWQHPSDFTRRNYQRRFGNMMPSMALSEWQAKNSTTSKRFVNVPKSFRRSQFL